MQVTFERLRIAGRHLVALGEGAVDRARTEERDGIDGETDTVIPTESLNGTGNELDNVLIGSGDDNVLSGLAGRDTLWDGSALNVDSGVVTSGNDTLIGCTGYDTYLFNLGGGIDTIQDTAMVGTGRYRTTPSGCLNLRLHRFVEHLLHRLQQRPDLERFLQSAMCAHLLRNIEKL